MVKNNRFYIINVFYEFIASNKLLVNFILIFISFQCFNNIFSQEVNLEVAGKRQIESFYRILKPAKTIDSVIPISNIQYPLLSLKFRTNFALDTIKIAKIKLVEKLEPLNPFYIKFGLGNGISTLFDGYYGTLRSRKNFLTAKISHRAFLGKITSFAPSSISSSNIVIENKWLESKREFQSKLYFSDLFLHQYGIPNEKIRKDSIVQRWNTFGADVSFKLKKKDTLAFQHKFSLAFQHFREKKPFVDSLNNLRIIENNIKLCSDLLYRFGNESIHLNSSISYNIMNIMKNSDSIYTYRGNKILNQAKNDLLISLNPFVKSFSKDLKLKYRIGLNFSIDNNVWKYHQFTKAYIYPDIEVKYSIFHDLFIPYLSINGSLKQNTAYYSSNINPFILSNNLNLNENQWLNSTLGFKGSISDRIYFNFNMRLYQSKNAAFFISDTLQSYGNEFSIIYDDLSRIGTEFSIIYENENFLKCELYASYFNNKTKSQPFAWNLPDFTSKFRLNYSGVKNLTLQLDCVIENGRVAFSVDSLKSSGIKNGAFYYRLPIILDFNFEAQYMFYKNIFVFFQANNFLAQKYQKWYYYPSMGLQVLGGLAIKF